jgi:hypothetical protein
MPGAGDAGTAAKVFQVARLRNRITPPQALPQML